MDRSERLLDLVALFLDAKAPLSQEDVRVAFESDYGPRGESALRKFERDKAELIELGLPLTYVPANDEFEAGYVLDKAAYYLPSAPLTDDELAVLYAAGSAALASRAFPGSEDLAHALRKLAFFSDRPLPAPKVRLDAPLSETVAGRLEGLWAAVNAKKFVDVEYYSPRTKTVTQRRVDPYGLALRRGAWNLVGHCHLRNALRTFQVHRIRSHRVNATKPKSPDFEVPADFRVEAHVATYPWQHEIHAALEVEVELRGVLAEQARALFPLERHEGGRVFVKATHVEGLLTFVLSLGSDARIVGPQAAVERHRQLALDVANKHRGDHG